MVIILSPDRKIWHMKVMMTVACKIIVECLRRIRILYGMFCSLGGKEEGGAEAIFFAAIEQRIL